MKVTKTRGVIKFEDEVMGNAYYDLATGKMSRQTKLRLFKEPWEVKGLQSYFRGKSVNAVFESCEDKGFVEFVKKIVRIEDMCSNIGTFLSKLTKYNNLEAYSRVGINVTNSKWYPVRTLMSSLPKDIIAILINTSNEHTGFKLDQDNLDGAIARDKQMLMDYIRYAYKRGGTWGVKTIMHVLSYNQRYEVICSLEKQGYRRNLLAEYIVYIVQTENVSSRNIVTRVKDYYEMSKAMHTISLEESGSRLIQDFFKVFKEEGKTAQQAIEEMRIYYPFPEKIKTLTHRLKKIDRYQRYLTSKHDIVDV